MNECRKTRAATWQEAVAIVEGNYPPSERIGVEGLAVPWEVADCYGEIAHRGALRPENSMLPILVDHDEQKCPGLWTEFQERDDGLWVRGWAKRSFVTEAREFFPHLSICFSYDSTLVSYMASRQRRRRADGTYIPTHLTRTISAEILEISIVNGGAFPGTHWRIIEEENK